MNTLSSRSVTVLIKKRLLMIHLKTHQDGVLFLQRYLDDCVMPPGVSTEEDMICENNLRP